MCTKYPYWNYSEPVKLIGSRRKLSYGTGNETKGIKPSALPISSEHDLERAVANTNCHFYTSKYELLMKVTFSGGIPKTTDCSEVYFPSVTETSSLALTVVCSTCHAYR